VQEPLEFLGHLESKFRAGIATEKLLESSYFHATATKVSQRRFVEHSAATALLPAIVTRQIECFVGRDGY
jgi:hypothetical protein